MTKVNIHLNVPEHIYDDVVHPRKRAKKLNSLIVSLLEAYHSNDAIREFIDTGDVTSDTNTSMLIDEALGALNETVFGLSAAGQLLDDSSDAIKSGLGVDVEESVPQSDSIESRLDRIESILERLVVGDVVTVKPYNGGAGGAGEVSDVEGFDGGELGSGVPSADPVLDEVDLPEHLDEDFSLDDDDTFDSMAYEENDSEPAVKSPEESLNALGSFIVGGL